MAKMQEITLHFSLLQRKKYKKHAKVNVDCAIDKPSLLCNMYTNYYEYEKGKYKFSGNLGIEISSLTYNEDFMQRVRKDDFELLNIEQEKQDSNFFKITVLYNMKSDKTLNSHVRLLKELITKQIFSNFPHIKNMVQKGLFEVDYEVGSFEKQEQKKLYAVKNEEDYVIHNGFYLKSSLLQ